MIKESIQNRLNPQTRKIEIGFVKDVEEADLYNDKKLDDLVRQGRIPSFKFIENDDYYHSDDYAVIDIPPVGVSFGYKVLKNTDGRYEFYVGEKFMGESKPFRLGTISARHIEGMVNKRLAMIGRADTPPYEILEK